MKFHNQIIEISIPWLGVLVNKTWLLLVVPIWLSHLLVCSLTLAFSSIVWMVILPPIPMSFDNSNQWRDVVGLPESSETVTLSIEAFIKLKIEYWAKNPMESNVIADHIGRFQDTLCWFKSNSLSSTLLGKPRLIRECCVKVLVNEMLEF